MNTAHSVPAPVFRGLRFRRMLFCLLLSACGALSASSSGAQVWMQKLVPAIQVQAATPMLPYLDWLSDPSGRFSVEEVALPEHQASFRPLNMNKLPYESGTIWLRFTLAPRPLESRPSTLLLDLGEGVPSTPTLYVPRRTMTPGVTEWQDFTPSQHSVFLMPDARSTPVTAYIKMDGLPGIWFDPMLRTPHNAATAMERLARPAVIVALAVVMLLCLLRGLSERGEWRIWTGCFTGAALLHAIWGAPATPHGHVAMADIGTVLAPGVALMLLPHVGRHLMCTRSRARVYDIQYFLLTLPGAVLALLPLIPGFSWTCRFLALWPLGALLLAPTTVGAWLSGLPGARRFLLGCLAPAAGTGLGILGIGSSAPASLTATAPLWGLALGALIIAGTATTRDQRENDASRDAETSSAPPPPETELRIMAHDDPPEGDMAPPVVETPPSADAPSAPDAEERERRTLVLEKRLRAPLDVLLREGAALGECSLPPAARQHAEAMVNAVRSMAVTLADPTGSEAPPAAMENGEQVFDLQQMLREAHDTVAVSAENKNVALSWFMPPYLPQRYEGDGTRLSQVLRMLLESSVRATGRGAVQLAVRRVPESVDPGHLLFTVTDTGDGVPPAERSSLALARAWELAGAHKGFLGVESGPQGASVSFTVHLGVHQGDVGVESAAAPVEQAAARSIIVADDSPSNRQLLAFFLEGLPYQVREARTAEDAAGLFREAPAALLVFDGDMFADQTLSAVARIRAFEREQGLSPACMLALTEDDSRWDALHEAGFTHALTKPVTRSGLRKTVLELLPPAAEPAAPRTPAGLDAAAMPPLSMEPPAPAPRDEDAAIIDTGLPLPSVPAEHGRLADQPLRMTPQAAPSVPSMPSAPSVPARPEEPVSASAPDVSSPEAASVSPASPEAAPTPSAPPVPPAPPVEPPLRMNPPDTASSQPDAMEDLLTDLFGPETPRAPSARSAQSPSAPFPAEEPLRMTPPERAAEWAGDSMPLPRIAPSPVSASAAPRLAPSAETFEPLRFGPSEESLLPTPVEPAPESVRHDAAPGFRNARSGPALAPDAGEWVGEPMPVGSPASRPSARPARVMPSPVSPEPGEGRAEWVGDPVPVPGATPRAVAGARNMPSARPRFPASAAPRPAAEAEEEPPFIPLTLEPSPREPVRRVSGRQAGFRESPGQPGDRRPLFPAAAPRPQPAPVTAPVTQRPSERMPPPATRQESAFAPSAPASSARAPSPSSGTVSGPPPVSPSTEAAASGTPSPIAGLLVALDAAMFDARTAFAQGDPQSVQAAADRIASQADGCGLRVLARMARCVEGAARARDRDALTYLLPELETAVERNRIALMPKK